jgi:hypothetical protein
MRVLHVCFGSYTLLTGNRLLYSVGNGNKSTDAADENGRSAQFVCIAKRRSGLCGGGQLLGPCRLASGLSLRGTLPFGAVLGGSIADVYASTASPKWSPLNLREKD